MFNNYAIVQGVDHIVPVDIYLPGCPPRPEMLLDSILKLHDRIENMKLGKNRVREIEELEQAQLARLPLHTQALPSQQLLQIGDRPTTATREHGAAPAEAEAHR
jgi:NADH:ubiquinone oxidoreductase subunit B-like Fe-S oxidoreductase